MHRKLEFQADRIEAVLAVNGVSSRVMGGTVTPRWVRFQVLPTLGAKISKIKGLSEELAAALDASSCRVSRRGATIAVEVPRDDPQPVRLLPMYCQLTENTDGKYHSKDGQILPVTALLGLAEDGAPLLIRLPSPDMGHVLISGVEGAGKTTLLYSIVTSLALAGDPDEVAFCFLGDIATMAEPVRELGFQATTDTKWPAMVGAIYGAGKRIIVVADDVTGPAMTASKLARLTGIKKLHFVLAWDGVPSKEVVNLFKARVVGKVASAKDAHIAAGCRGTGAKRLLGRGDFLAVAEGRVIHFQAAHVTPGEIAAYTRR